MKRLKEVIKSNAIIITAIDLIAILLYLMMVKKLCKINFSFNLYDFSVLWLFMTVCYSKNKNKEMIRIINKILEKDSKNEKNNNR